MLANASVFCAAPTARVYTYNTSKNVYLAQKLANNQPITYCVYVSEAGKRISDVADFDQYVKLAFKLWTAYPAQAIRAAGREGEFYPVLQALEKEPNLVRLPECDFSKYPREYLQFLDTPPSGTAQAADISFFFEDSFFARMNGREKIAPHYTFKPVPRVVIPTRFNKNHSNANTLGDNAPKAAGFIAWRKRMLATPNYDFAETGKRFAELNALWKEFGDNQKSLFYSLLHETGHAVGLADQRASSLDNSDILYGTVEPRASVMDNWTTRLTCDDADGVIMLFDDALNVKRTDFNSLCKDGIQFSEGKESFKGEKKNQYRTRNEEMVRTYYEHTKDTGVYLFEKSDYISLATAEESENLLELFDRTKMPTDAGGYQHQKGLMKIVDLNDSENRVPVGKYVSTLTLGPMAMHRQILTEEYDNDGKLLSYTLEIYSYDTLLEKRTVENK